MRQGEHLKRRAKMRQRSSRRGSGKNHFHAKAQTANTSLDPVDWKDFRQLAHRMLDDMLGSIENIRDRPVWEVIPNEVRAHFRESLPLAPTALAKVHEEFMTTIMPFTARNSHPGFMGWVQGGGTPVGMMAEMLAAGLNANLGGRDQIPLDVENQVTDWMRALFGFPAEATGLFVTGTSIANFIAVVVARDARLGCDVRRQGVSQNAQKLTAYASVAAHGCIGRALDFAGLGSDALRLVPIDSGQRIDLKALEQAIKADRDAGFNPFLVIGTAGTVDTGAIDDLAGIAAICAENKLWFHVDGAYGALAMLAPELAPRLKGIELADSLAFDFHKWAQVQYDAGFILVRDGTRHQQAFASSSAYLTREERGMSAGSPWPCDLGPDLSRGFRALKTWMTLKVYGMNAIGAVISHTCELARYLESRIVASTELEMMASVELNIVCFRYRFATPGDPATALNSDQLNRKIAIQLQESGAVAPSTTVIAGQLAIRAAIVNHRTTRAEMDTLVEATLDAGRALQSAARPSKPDQGVWRPWLKRNARVRQVDAELAKLSPMPTDVEVDLLVERATLLAEMGRSLEARSDHLRVLELDPSHLPNLFALGKLLVAAGQHKAAQMVYAEAVKYHPEDIVCQVNLGSALLQGGNPEEARTHYEAALRIDPEFPPAHGGMYYVLTRLGEVETAKLHQRKSFGQKSLFPSLYRGKSQPIPVLLFVSSTGGNTPIEKLLDDRIFETYVVVADFYDARIPLPLHQFVVNGIGDSDLSAEALDAVESLLAFTSAPILNEPAAVRATSRCDNAKRLSKLPGLITPATLVFRHALLAGPDGPAALAARGFTFPLLLRTPGFHMGQHFCKVDSASELVSAVDGLPGSGRPEAEVLAIEYLDARGSDGCARKYRVMMVGGQLYPLHLAISQNWKIHYFSADMVDRAGHRAEEAEFLTNMPGVLGSKAMAALQLVQASLGLDYGGIDFGLNRQGEVLLFEANATMVVEQPNADQRWDYRRAAVERIHDAVRKLFLTSAVAARRSLTVSSQ
jgi:glutamate/tyrosine decarboxylase-like PLP-dependent enzyme/glutathione synthase/RimK-type ligase-like ATP-grasp enzyme